MYLYIYVYIYIYMYIHIVAVVVVGALSTCRREQLPDDISLGRVQGRCRPVQRWPGGCRRLLKAGWGAACFPGGKGARVAEGGTTSPRDPCSLPRCGGRVRAPVRDGCRMGDGGRNHLSGDLRGPGSPAAPTPPLQGRGHTSCAKVEEGGGGMFRLYPCVPFPFCVVSVGCAMGCCSRQRGPCGTWERPRACGGCAARGGGVPYGIGRERGCFAGGLGNGRSDGSGRGSCPRSGYSS